MDWLVVNGAASARVVRLASRWISTSSSRTGSGRPQGRPRAAGVILWSVSVSTLGELMIG